MRRVNQKLFGFSGKIRTVLTVVLCASFCICIMAGSVELRDLQQDMDGVDSRIEKTREELKEKRKERSFVRRKVTMSSDELKSLYEEMKKLEARLIEVRSEYNNKLALHNDVRAIDQEHEELFRRLEKLQTERTLILNEIKLEQKNSAVSVE